MAANVEWARNLKKSQLGGVIFGCTNITVRECLTSQLFGLPGKHFLYVQNIEPGLPLFLFNYSERKLHGIYEAASSGKMNIDLHAWTRGGSDRTNFPAQVQIRVRLQCQALSEYQFKPIIADNYYTHNHFRFELDHNQASQLISVFSSLPVGPRTLVPKSPKNRIVAVKRSPSDDNIEETGPPEPPHLTGDVANVYESTGKLTASSDSQSLDRNQLEESPCTQNDQMTQPDERDLNYMKLKELALSLEFSDANIMECVVEAASKNGSGLLLETHGNALLISGKGKDESSSGSFDYPAIISQLCGEIEELKAFKQKHTLKMASLEENLVNAKQQINQLESKCMILGSVSFPSGNLAGDGALTESSKFNLNLDQSIFLVGGYDGMSWSSALDSYSPSHDVLRSLKPMPSVRAYASVNKLDGELYVLGGASGSMWCDTVESYNAVNNQWTLHPSLNEKKGSLAVAALNGKLFALGGGNGLECFSVVEMFDPNVGRWISACSMLQKRFSLTAVELHGALYATGGYDGNNYLKSAERFDPREYSWTRICDMNTERGCHSLVVIDEKLYAIGGYDGTTMVPSVEIYDPRVGTWMTGEPMNQGRGYSAAAVLSETIFVIGGVKSGGDGSDLIECYKEGQGWQETNLRAVGKRCFASAIVLGED